MRIDEQFPSKYLKAADLKGHVVPVRIDRVDIEDISGGEMKPVLYFQNKEKGLVLNKTNSNTIAAVYGYETEEWQGQPIELFEMTVDFQGRMVPAIRVRVARNRSYARPPAAQQSPTPAPSNGHEERHPSAPILDDEIPFISNMTDEALLYRKKDVL